MFYSVIILFTFYCECLCVCVCVSSDGLMSGTWIFYQFEIWWWHENGGKSGDSGCLLRYRFTDNSARRWTGHCVGHNCRIVCRTIGGGHNHRGRWMCGRCDGRCHNDYRCRLLATSGRAQCQWILALSRIGQLLQYFVETVIFIAILAALQMLVVHGDCVEQYLTFCTQVCADAIENDFNFHSIREGDFLRVCNVSSTILNFTNAGKICTRWWTKKKHIQMSWAWSEYQMIKSGKENWLKRREIRTNEKK